MRTLKTKGAAQVRVLLSPLIFETNKITIMNDLLNSLSQMSTIKVVFWFIMVSVAAYSIGSIVFVIIRAWCRLAPKSFCAALIIIGASIAAYGAIGLFL